MRRRLFVAVTAGTAFIASGEEVIRIDRSNGGKPVPRFSNEFLIFFDRELATVTSYKADGVMQVNTTLSLPGTSKLQVREVCADRDGTLAVAASATSSDGTSVVSTLFLIGANGQTLRAWQTPAYGPLRLVFSPAGSLWTIGREYDGTFRDIPEHMLLREYSRDGKLIRSALPRTSFASPRHPVGSVFLASGADRLGVFSDAAGEYVELDWSGNVRGRWPLPGRSKAEGFYSGAAISAAGEFYAGSMANNEQMTLQVVRLERDTGRLVPVPVPAQKGDVRASMFLGVSGDELVLYGRPSSMIRVPAR